MTAWLLTWLWQGSALAGGVAIALACAPRLNAATRHLIWWGSFAALAWIGWASSPYGGLPPVPLPGSDPVYVPSAPDTLLTVFLGAWAAIALVSLLRLLPGLRGVYTLRDRCQPFPASLESRLPLWRDARTRGRATQLMICDAVSGATVLGFERPCIAIPSSLVAGLTDCELDQVILHEHAHVQRRDDWTRLAQTLLMSVLWVHPAAVFVSRALSREREMACDEWVVTRTGQPKAYARCLARAAELRLRMRGGPSLVPALIGGRHELVRRVDRLLAMRARPAATISLGAAGLAVCALLLMSVQLQSVRIAEIAEIVLPIVQVPSLQWAQPVRSVQEVQDVREVRRAQRVRQVLPAPIAPDAAPTATPAAPLAVIAPDLSTRTFPGIYGAPMTASASIAPGTPITSDRASIASTAKKTGMNIASAFTRAGAAVAQRF